jgi:glycosyltransferase involved in cell wall biosynthesis
MSGISDTPCRDELSTDFHGLGYTLGLFANMYPAFDGDYRGIFIQQMVRDLESRGVTVKKAVKISPSLMGYASFYYQSVVLARDPGIDLIQAEYIPHSSLIPAYFRPRNIPLVLKFHGDDARIFPFKNHFNLFLTRAMIKRAAHVVTSSEEIRRILIGIGAKPEHISSIHTGVDTVFFSPGNKEESRVKLGLSYGKTIFLFIGRLHAWKGINELLEVAHSCPEFQFIFVGPGSIPSHSFNCSFVGPKPPEELRTWLNAADCLVLPTHTDAVPAVVMEAFSCGIPAITTDVGGCPEIVEPGKTGILVPLMDTSALREAVLWMHNHPDERKEMGKQARVTVKEGYDHTLLIEKLISIHRSLIDNK